MDTIEIRTKRREEIVDVTAEVARVAAASGRREGLCTVFVPHTTAGLTINENSDPDVKADILMALGRAVPDALPYAHAEGNSPAHVKASLMGSSVSVVVEDGRLRLGTWQGICLCEFDGPRTRQVWIKIT
ncbi:MAG TPA: secondary thiamine-phosphate synthase enzyme YjbQ [Burkholderiales bacterium]|nr:secondary thiamine-phosphate synthase enzyme YjbQ [Burkholderiales bacterium]